MTAPQLNTAMNNLLASAFQLGVGKGKMTALDVAGILATHTANTLMIIQSAQANLDSAHKVANEIVIPFTRKPEDDSHPN